MLVIGLKIQRNTHHKQLKNIIPLTLLQNYTSTSESHTTEEHTSHTSEEHTSHTSEEHTSHTSEEHTSHTTSDFVRVTKYNAGDLMCAVGDYL
jgi:ABC-type Zn2+ transport system substrate-binding protein/surface adhesin